MAGAATSVGRPRRGPCEGLPVLFLNLLIDYATIAITNAHVVRHKNRASVRFGHGVAPETFAKERQRNQILDRGGGGQDIRKTQALGQLIADLSVVECERDNIVEQKIRVLQVNLSSSLEDDEVLDWRKVRSIRQLDTESQGVRLSASSDDEVPCLLVVKHLDCLISRNILAKPDGFGLDNPIQRTDHCWLEF